MENKKIVEDQYALAVYMLKHRFNTPLDLVKYWSFTGPCLESHPSIEDYTRDIR